MKSRIFLTALLAALIFSTTGAQQGLQTPEQFFGFRMGTDNKLARWDKIVDYFKQVSGATDRIRFRELGKSTNGNPFIALEIASADTLKNLDKYKQMERKLYFQGGAPTDAARRIFRQGGRRAHHHDDHATRLAPRRWWWSWCTGSRPTTRRR
jgi:hypothetical protein